MLTSAVSSYGEVIPVPDIIESTVGLLSLTFPRSSAGDSSEKIVDNIMTHNEAAEVEKSMPKNKHDQSAHTQITESFLEDINNATQFALEPHSVAKAVASQEHSTLKPCLVLELHFPKNKKKVEKPKLVPEIGVVNDLMNPAAEDFSNTDPIV